MEEIRTLPPLVRGKVTGFLDFFVDEVRIFRNILLLTDKCNIIVQVQWWGEKLPVYIIPQHFCSKQNHDRSYNFQNTYFHSATYKIKTKFDLFKSYLKTCEVLELAVLRAVENLVIGSAFMKDLIRLINNIHDPITLPLVDSLGEEIGEVKIHTNFSQGSCRVSKNEYFSQSIENSILTNNSRYTIKDSELSQKIDSDNEINYETARERCSADFKTRDIHKVNQDFKVLQLEDSQNELTKQKSNSVNTGFDLCGNGKCEIEINHLSRSNEKCKTCRTMLSDVREDFTQAKEKLESKNFPQTHMLSDCSKVLYFELQGSKKFKNSKKYVKTEKHNSKSIDANFAKGKRRQTKISDNPDRLSTKLKSSSVKKKTCTENKKSVQGPQKTLCKVHECNEKEQNNFKKELTKTTDINTQTHLGYQNRSVKEGDEKILNYLLGYKMTKDDEQCALNDLRRTSLSPNFVESINELCTSQSFYRKPKSNDNQEVTYHKLQTPKNVPKKTNHLKFDLSNTIERNYYKKFFTSECSQNAFQIAEYLNTPKNDSLLENCERLDVDSLKEPSHFHTSFKEHDLEKNPLNPAKLQGGSDNSIEQDVINNAASSFWSHEKVPSDCSNCKYYKQFSELDTIIESLKDFDKKSIKKKDN